MLLQNIYWTLMIGFVTGALSRIFIRGMLIGEVFSAMTMGLIGSVMIGWIGSVVGLYEYGEPIGLWASVVGAAVMVSIYVWMYKKAQSPKK